MAYDFKKINELELVNGVPEGANVLIETEGTTKRLPSTAINNGYSKEEVYNKNEADEKFLTKETIAKPDWNQNDENAADYVKNRTHYEETTVVNEPLNITWDGNTEGLVSVDDMFYKVLDETFTDEQIKLMAIKGYSGDDKPDVPITVLMEEGHVFFEGNITDVNQTVFFVREDGATYFDGAVVFPQKGVYVMSHITGITTTEPVEQTKTVVKKLDKKFLPDDVGGGSAPIVYIIDKSGDETVYSCSVDFETARTKRFSVPVYVKIITDKYCVREAFKVYTNGDDSSVDVHYEYYILEQGYSDSFVHDADGVHIVEPK